MAVTLDRVTPCSFFSYIPTSVFSLSIEDYRLAFAYRSIWRSSMVPHVRPQC